MGSKVGESRESHSERVLCARQQVSPSTEPGKRANLSTILLVFRKNWGYLFNSDPEVVQVVAAIMPAIALFQVR